MSWKPCWLCEYSRCLCHSELRDVLGGYQGARANLENIATSACLEVPVNRQASKISQTKPDETCFQHRMTVDPGMILQESAKQTSALLG